MTSVPWVLLALAGGGALEESVSLPDSLHSNWRAAFRRGCGGAAEPTGARKPVGVADTRGLIF